MSQLVKIIEDTVGDTNDFTKVLQDIAHGLHNKGFFETTNWCDDLVESFRSFVENERVEDSVVDESGFEISSSFVDESSKFSKKYKTSTVVNCTVNQNMFEDSNESFEIPETQADPPNDHINDECESEGFVVMPNEEIQVDVCSQSQVVLEGVELENESPVLLQGIESKMQSSNHQDFDASNHFDDTGNIDLEMSKLHWDDSAKDVGKDKNASGTTDMDFDCVTKRVDDDGCKSASVTPDLVFEGLSSTIAKIEESLLSPKQSKESIVSSSLDQNQTKENSSNITIDATSSSIECAETELLVIEKIASNAEHPPSDDVEMRHADATQLFAKPRLPLSEISKPNNIDGEKPDDVHVHLDETQVFVKSSPKDRKAEDDDSADEIDKLAKRKSRNRIISSEAETEDEENAKNEVVSDVRDTSVSPKRKRNPLIESSDDEEDADTSIYDAATQKFEAKKTVSPKRQRFLELKELCNKTNNEQSKVVYRNIFDQCKDIRITIKNCGPVASPINQTTKDAPVHSTVKENMKDVPVDSVMNGTTKEVSAASSVKQNEGNSTAVSTVENTTDMIAEEGNETAEDVAEASAANQKKKDVKNIVAEAPVRHSARSKGKGKDSKTTAEMKLPKAKAPKRQAGDISNVSSESDDANDKVDVEMAATQRFIKSSSTPKETIPAKRSARVQGRAVTMNSAGEVKKSIPQLLASKTRDQSVSYSPNPKNVTSDVKENVTVTSSDNDEAKSTGAAAPSRSRKRKPTTSVSQESISGSSRSSSVASNQGRKRMARASVSKESVAESSRSQSPSSNRSARNQNYTVMFTMIDPDNYKTILKELNISIAKTDNYKALITNQIYRTSKFMCALAAGKPIVSTKWLDALKTEKTMLDPFDFLLDDAAGEKKYKFKLADTLNKVVENGGLYKNYSILVTPNTEPKPDILKDIITSSGAKYLKTSLVPRKDDIILCIADQKDKKMMPQLKKKYPTLREISGEEFMESIFLYNIKS